VLKSKLSNDSQELSDSRATHALRSERTSICSKHANFRQFHARPMKPKASVTKKYSQHISQTPHIGVWLVSCEYCVGKEIDRRRKQRSLSACQFLFRVYGHRRIQDPPCCAIRDGRDT
jgi:hypothetical protein